jgi:hypothetical protein
MGTNCDHPQRLRFAVELSLFAAGPERQSGQNMVWRQSVTAITL